MTRYISYREILFLIAVSAGLYIVSLSSYLLFHGMVEVFCIAVATCIFMIAWNSRSIIKNNYLLFIGISFLFTSAIDLLHFFAYKGMGVFSGYDANLPTQLWIAARYLQSVSYLIAPIFLYRKIKINLNVNYLLVIYSFVFTLIIAAIFYWKIFPDCFIEGKGLTSFKISSEYVISLFFAVSIYFLHRARKELDENVYYLLVISIIMLIFSELAFTAYASVFGISNMFGHILKFAAFFLIYKAIIVTGFMKPYDLIFRELKKSEQDLIMHRDRLEELVIERTKEARLAKEEAQHASMAKTNFLLTMSHELRTPLNPILGFSKLLKMKTEGELNEKQEIFIDNIIKSGSNLLNTINQMLNIVRMYEGTLELKIEKIPVSGTLEEIIGIVRENTIKKNVTIEKNIGPEMEYIDADILKFKQVFINLVDNAVKFSKDEGGTVTIDAKKEGDMAKFSVSDTGIGIKEEDLDKIFERFTQLDPGTNRKYQGMGINLAISRGFVELHGGKLWVESEFGKGSTFTFTIPLKGRDPGS